MPHPPFLLHGMNFSLPCIMLLMVSFAPVRLPAAVPVNTEDHPVGMLYMDDLAPSAHLSKREYKTIRKQEHKTIRAERRMERFQKWLDSKKGQKTLGGLSDPIDKWFWFWTGSWVLGLLFSLIAGGAFLGIIGFIFFVAGSVSLVLWLTKKYG